MNMKKETTVAERDADKLESLSKYSEAATEEEILAGTDTDQAVSPTSALTVLDVEDNGRCYLDLDSPANAVDLASKKKYPDDPLDVVTGKFTPERILYSKDTFVVAQGTWKDKGKAVENSYACRWHDPDRVGYPNGFGRPQWFLLPAKDAGFITSETLEAMFSLIFK